MIGKKKVKCADVCQNLRHSALIGEQVRRVALPQEVWEEVMNPGLSQHPVGTSQVVWDTPPSSEQERDAMVLRAQSSRGLVRYQWS